MSNLTDSVKSSKNKDKLSIKIKAVIMEGTSTSIKV